MQIGNSIAAQNGSGSGGDVSGNVVSLGHNLIGIADGSSGWISSDLTGTAATPLNPQLLPLGNYGGSMPTMPPTPDSPAGNAGDSGRVFLATDQRGLPRIFGSSVDIGSVEPQYATVTGTSGNDTVTLGQNSWTFGGTTNYFTGTDPLATLTINGNGGSDTITLNYASGNPLPPNLRLNGLFTINGLQGGNPLGGTSLDIERSTVYITYASPASDLLSAIQSYLRNGYNSGAWNGAATASTGVIVSSAAAHNSGPTTGIGYADSADGIIAGQPSNTIELKYTLYGDTSLGGSVGFADFTRLTQGYNQTTGARWDTGDFNYDGSVNFADFTLLTRTYGTSLGSQAALSAAASSSAQPASTTVNGTAKHRRHRKGERRKTKGGTKAGGIE